MVYSNQGLRGSRTCPILQPEIDPFSCKRNFTPANLGDTMTHRILGTVPKLRAVLYGNAAYLLVYLASYATALAWFGRLARETTFGQYDQATSIAQAFPGLPTETAAGWLVYNAHLVPIQVSAFATKTVFGNTVRWQEANLLTGELGPELLLLIVPPAALLAAGYLLGGHVAGENPGRPRHVGMGVMFGYGLLAFAGALYFVGSVRHSTGLPDLLAVFTNAVLLYPLVFGYLGGYLAERYPLTALSRRVSRDLAVP